MAGRFHWLEFCETWSGTTYVRVFREGKELLLLAPSGVLRGFFVAGHVAERQRRPKVLAAAPRSEAAQGILGRQRDAEQRQTAEGIGRRAPHRSCKGTSLSPARCRATATTEGIGRRAPHRSRAGTSWLPARCRTTYGGRQGEVRCRLAPCRSCARGIFVTGHVAEGR